MEDRTSLMTIFNRRKNLKIARMYHSGQLKFKLGAETSTLFSVGVVDPEDRWQYQYRITWTRWNESVMYDFNMIETFIKEVDRLVPYLLFTEHAFYQNRSISIFPLSYHGDMSITFCFKDKASLDWFVGVLRNLKIYNYEYSGCPLCKRTHDSMNMPE